MLVGIRSRPGIAHLAGGTGAAAHDRYRIYPTDALPELGLTT
ncbi:hypothetical protein ACIO13_33815 [Streptomyces sp. NPDC087425]